MTFKEATAVIMLASQVVILAWLGYDLLQQAVPLTVAAVAVKLMWAIGAMIVFNIISAIVVAILVSIFTRKEFKDERADERDQQIASKSMRNAYFAVSIGGLACLLLLALGVDPTLAAFGLFGVLMLGGTTDAVSRLAYYRLR